MSFLHVQRATGNALPGGQSRARGVRGHSGQRGLSLVELLIAVALLGFVLLAIAPLFIASVKANYSGSQYTSVNMLARDRLEQLMNRSFLDAQLAPGTHSTNDQPAYLADALNPTVLSATINPFKVTYTVTQWAIPPSAGVPNGNAFTPVPVVVAGQPYQYKRIDVTVDSSTNLAGVSVPLLGIGARLVRVSGCLANPAADLNLSVAPCGPCP